MSMDVNLEAPQERPRRKRERYPPTERGVRVRANRNKAQERALVARGRARAVVWNWTCDIFERARARAKGEDPHGLAIQCTRKAVCEEIERLRREPGYRWLRETLTLWSCTRGRGTAGVMVAHSRGIGGYREADARGEVESTLTGLYSPSPWTRLQRGRSGRRWRARDAPGSSRTTGMGARWCDAGRAGRMSATSNVIENCEVDRGIGNERGKNSASSP